MVTITLVDYMPYCETGPGDTFVFEHEGEQYTAEMWCTNHASGLDCYVAGAPVEDPVEDLFDLLWDFLDQLAAVEQRHGLETLRKIALKEAIDKFNARSD